MELGSPGSQTKGNGLSALLLLGGTASLPQGQISLGQIGKSLGRHRWETAKVMGRISIIRLGSGPNKFSARWVGNCVGSRRVLGVRALGSTKWG